MKSLLNETSEQLRNIQENRFDDMALTVVKSENELALHLFGMSFPKIFIAVKGSSEVVIGQANYTVDSKNLLAVGRTNKIEVNAGKGSELYELSLNLDQLVIYIHKDGERESISIPYHQSIYQNKLIEYWQMLTFEETPPILAEPYNKNLASLILITTCILAEDSKWLKGKLRYSQKRRKFFQIFSYMCQNISKELYREKICEEFDISIKHFTELFQYWQRSSFKQVHTQLRLNLARQLMRRNKVKIEELAERCGFNSSVHFIYTYKQNFNMSPLKQQKLLKNGIPKSMEELEALYYQKGFEFIDAKPAETLPDDAQTLQINTVDEKPTVCVLINESGNAISINYFTENGDEKELIVANAHSSHRYNVIADNIFIFRNLKGEIMKWVRVEDKLCQAIIT